MEISSDDFPCLELTIAMPGFSSFPSLQSYDHKKPICTPLNEEEGGARGMKYLSGEEYESQNPRKKLRLTKEQSRVLEESFRQNHTLNPKQKEGLAEQLKLKPRQVEVWFQNRRARSKLKQTELECEYLKKWFGSLSEQNRRLKKEVEEQRGMNVGPKQLPAATLTMCPRCECVATKGPATTTTTTPTKIIYPSAAC